MPDTPQHVRILLSALQFGGGSREGLRTLTRSEWEDLLSLWEIQRLMVPLRQTCSVADELPEWVRFRIDQNLANNAERLERIKAAYSDFSNALRGTGAKHVVIKGFTLWPGFVEHPRFRLQSDIDIYCPPESILCARDALAQLGYEPERGLDSPLADHSAPMAPKTSWRWRGNYYDPEMPVSFELHFRFWNEGILRLRAKGLEQFWLRRVERHLDNISFPALCAADNFGYAALNLTRNLLRDQPSPHQIYELARFLHLNADNHEFWKGWRETQDDSLRRLEAVSCLAALHCFACRLSEEVREETERLPRAAKLWFEQFKDFPVSWQFLPSKDWLWLHLSLVESNADRFSILRKRLFPMLAVTIDRVDLPDLVGDEQKGPSSPWRRRARYLAYIVSRLGYHSSLLPATLWRGACFWWSTKTLGAQFWIFFVTSFLFDVGMFMFFFLYNLYLLNRGLKEDFLGLIVSANSIGSVVSCIPSGMLAQRVGLRRALLLCITLVTVISALLTLVASKPALLVLSFLLGAAMTIWAVAISPATARLTSKQNRQFGFSLIFSSGIAVGLLGSAAASRMPGWLAHMSPLLTTIRAKQLTLLTGCAIVALSAWPAFRIHFPASETGKTKVFPRNSFLLRFLPVIAVWSLVTGSFSPFYNVYFSKYLQMPIEHIGVVTSASQVAQALAILAAPFMFRRAGLVSGIVYTQIATAIALGCLAGVHVAATAALIYVGFAAFQWMNQPGIYSLLMSHVTQSEQAGASALNFLVISLVQAIAAAIAGNSFVTYGYPRVLAATAAVAVVAALLFHSLLGKKFGEASEAAIADFGLG